MRRVLLIVPILLICLILIYKYKNLDEKTQRLERDISLLISVSDPQTKNLLEKRMRDVRFKSDREKVDVMEDIILSKADLDDVLDTISSDAKKSKVVVNSLKVAGEKSVVNTKEAVIKKISISADVSGSFNCLENFLGEISASERFISVENISMKKEGGVLRALIFFFCLLLARE